MSQPRVSVIVPVYNKAPYLRQAIESVWAQTLTDIELICIDNGSTDGSSELLRELAQEANAADVPVATSRANDELADGAPADELAATAPASAASAAAPSSTAVPCVPLHVIELPQGGPGAARNAGLDVAQGEFISFLDADDFLEPCVLARAVERACALGADLVVWDAWVFDDVRGRDLARPATDFSSLSAAGEEPPASFRACDHADVVFRSLQNWPWNKLFRRSFIEGNHLRFPALMRTEDCPFSCMAAALAERIACIPERLSHYRVNTGTSAMDNKDAYPLDFYQAYLLLREQLEAAGLYDSFERGFAAWTLDGCVYNLNSLHDYRAFELVFGCLHDMGLRALGWGSVSLDGLLNDFQLECLRRITEGTAQDYLVWRCAELEGTLAATRDWLDEANARAATAEAHQGELRDELVACRVALDDRRMRLVSEQTRRELAESRLDDLRRSAEYRSGTVICKLPRMAQQALGKGR